MTDDGFSEDGPFVPAGQLVDALAVAGMLGVTRYWVYEHAAELGAIPLGSGRRPRLRFDPHRVAQALHDGFGSLGGQTRARRFRRSKGSTDVELLPIAGVRSERGPRGT